MTMCANEAVAGCDQRYWTDSAAATPVLLIDEATEAITEAVHRLRCGSMLEERDVAAAGVALSDLFGGLSQLAELCTTVVSQHAGTDPLHIGRSEPPWQTLRMMMLSAQQVVQELEFESADSCSEKIPVPRYDHNEIERFSNCTPPRALGRSLSDRPLHNSEIRLVKISSRAPRSAGTA